MQCAHCGAALGVGSNYCSHCGSRNDIDLAMVHEYTRVAPDSERQCPECNQVMQTVDIGQGERFLIEQCPELHGLFFDPNELEYLLDTLVKNVFEVDYSRLATGNREFYQRANFRYRPCPVCRRLMNRRNFGTRSGVVVDHCRDHGTWLDAGKLQQLCEWRKAGGQLLAESDMPALPPQPGASEQPRETPTFTPGAGLFSARRQYWIVIRQGVDGATTAECPDIPGIRSEANREDLAVENLKQQLSRHLAGLRGQGVLTPPARTRCVLLDIDPEDTKR